MKKLCMLCLLAPLPAFAQTSPSLVGSSNSYVLTIPYLEYSSGGSKTAYSATLRSGNGSNFSLDFAEVKSVTALSNAQGAATLTASNGVWRLSLPFLNFAGGGYAADLLSSNLTAFNVDAASVNNVGTLQAGINCANIKASITGYAVVNSLSVTCDNTYAYISSYGIQTAHPMMNGITQTILQVPIPQNFTGSNAWKIPLLPAIAANTTTAVDGPIGIAVNGVPIFNPCKQGGCDTATGGGDTKVQGELDACNGHAGRADDYHYHAAPICMMADQSTHYWDTHPVGWALDGFAIFGYYNPDGSTATRDSICGGNTLAHDNAPAGYAYHLTDASPYVLSCFRGTPSPDLAGQGGKFSPLRTPTGPGGGPGVANMTLSATATTLAIGGTSTLQWQQNGTTYQVLYTRTSNLCWDFVFKTSGTQTNAQSYCRKF